ncbi:endospore germination permease [Paenibacillus sp. OV219]|uniref:GerAB/ArcD/ProY family transporter n=1 Tax=Paenibacillus sp. OV219 TaxID=1884377 RepID=UPI0008D0A748|nr:endospore germination permease [Paenibacillus sp. OV219]SEO01281.1 spore germination protein KB [Paenibacillus sp. OV219]
MSENGKINGLQLMVLTFLYTIGTTVLVVPAGLAATAKQDAWIGAICGVLIGAVILALYLALWVAYPGQTFVGICRSALGKWAGTVLGVIYTGYGFIGASTVLFYVGNFFQTQFVPHTPLWCTIILFAFVVVMGARLGLETIARATELMLPWFLMLFVLLVITLVPTAKSANVLPLFEAGWKPLFSAGLSFAGTAYMPIVFLFSVLPKVQAPEKARIGMYITGLLGGVCVILITLLCILILGPNITERSMYPSYALVKKINIGNFLQRVEAILAGLWFITTYVKTTFYYYASVTSLAEIVGIKQYRVLTLPCAMIMIVFSLIVYPDVIYMHFWDSIVFPPYIMVIGVVIPLLLWIIGIAKQKPQQEPSTSAQNQLDKGS